jgi:hypothetical protein
VICRKSLDPKGISATLIALLMVRGAVDEMLRGA